MPAIDLPILTNRIARLLKYFDKPDEFVRELHNILDVYSNRAKHRHIFITHDPNLNSYDVPAPVIKEIEKELILQIQRSPSSSIKLANALWEESNLEYRNIAIFILGLIQDDYMDEVTNILIKWCEGANSEFITEIANNGMKTLRLQRSNQLIMRCEKLLDSKNTNLRLLALNALNNIIKDEKFNNLPTIINIVNPLLIQADEALKNTILELTQSLIQRTPIEMTYVLRKNYERYKTDYSAWLIRRSMNLFSPSQQNSLKKILQ